MSLKTPVSRLGMSVTTQGGSGRQYVTCTGPGRTISKYRLVVLNVYRFRETYDTINRNYLILSLYICPRHLAKLINPVEHGDCIQLPRI